MAPKLKVIVPPAWFSGAATRVVSNGVWEWAEIWDTRSKQWDSTNVRFTTADVKAGRPLSGIDYGFLGIEAAPDNHNALTDQSTPQRIR